MGFPCWLGLYEVGGGSPSGGSWSVPMVVGAAVAAVAAVAVRAIAAAAAAAAAVS